MSTTRITFTTDITLDYDFSGAQRVLAGQTVDADSQKATTFIANGWAIATPALPDTPPDPLDTASSSLPGDLPFTTHTT